MEIFDLYDIDRVKQQDTMIRGEKCPENLCRLVVHVCIFNNKGEMLIQQRDSSKKDWPNAWDITLGGCAKSGETSAKAIQRELQEELGIEHDFTNVRPYLTINFDNGFDDIYFITKDLNIDDVKFVDGEVQAAKWASCEEILKMIDSKEFIRYYKTFIAALFEMREKNGAHKN